MQQKPADPNDPTTLDRNKAGFARSQIAPEFKKYFIDSETMETNILEQMKILKNIKDYLLILKNLKD